MRPEVGTQAQFMLMVFPFTSTCFLSEPQMDPIGEEIQFHLPMRSH